jgi:hypothetical protein
MIDLIPASEVRRDTFGDEHVVYEGRLGLTIVWLVFVLVGVAWCLAPLLHPGAWILAILFGLPCVLVSLAFMGGVVRGWKKKWWIAIVRHDEVLLRIRSYLNSDLPETDATIVRIGRSSISRVREAREHRIVPGLEYENDASFVSRSLDFVLTPEDTAALEAAIARERNQSRRNRGHFSAYPVLVPQAGIVRVVWRGHTMRLTPSLRRALDALRRFSYPIDAQRLESHADWRRIPESEIDAAVDECVAEGNEFQAIRLLRARRKMDLTRAKAELERRRTKELA